MLKLRDILKFINLNLNFEKHFRQQISIYLHHVNDTTYNGSRFTSLQVGVYIYFSQVIYYFSLS